MFYVLIDLQWANDVKSSTSTVAKKMEIAGTKTGSVSAKKELNNVNTWLETTESVVSTLKFDGSDFEVFYDKNGADSGKPCSVFTCDDSLVFGSLVIKCPDEDTANRLMSYFGGFMPENA